ncbi:MAG: type II toxin-antitoxin system PemK/MazF family toxin [Candidatus Latescibacterota bacterium]|jgi:mRNA interferase MazF|tara:strand:+ start:59 stop:391 length:333 start_codon:yes stop_codon:yes gene_type:complete
MANFPQRYEIYFADLNPTIGSEIRKVRPVVVVSQNEMNQFLNTVVACPLTSTLHPQWRSRLQIQCAGKDAEIAVDQIRTISKERLKNKIDALSADDAIQFRRIITEMYGE